MVVKNKKLVKNIKTTWAYPTIDNYCSRPLVRVLFPKGNSNIPPTPTLPRTLPRIKPMKTCWTLSTEQPQEFPEAWFYSIWLLQLAVSWRANLEDTAAGGPIGSMDPGNHQVPHQLLYLWYGHSAHCSPIVGTIFMELFSP